jgi:hypothetical protein
VPGASHGIAFFVQTSYEGLVLIETLTFFNQSELELTHHLQRLQVIAANLTTYVARPASQTGVDDVSNGVGIRALSFDKRATHRVSAAGGVTIEMMIGNAGTIFGKTPALHLVKRDPLAVGTLAASIHLCREIFQCHFILLFTLKC